MYRTVGGEKNSGTLDGLDENAAYTVQMFATTGGGQGKIGNIVAVSTFGECFR